MNQCVDSKALHNRLNRIIGQINAINRMIDDGTACEDILIQINAAKSALHKAGQWYLKVICVVVSAKEFSMEMLTKQ